jgi:hypothetical protein
MRKLMQYQLASAEPPKADIVERNRDVRFMPKADSCTAAIFLAIRSPGRRGQVAEAIF